MDQEKLWQWLSYIPWNLMLAKAGIILLIIFVSYIILKVRTTLINRIFSITTIDLSKKQSLISILMSLTRYVVYVIGLLLILKQFVDITPLIAGVGILGLAIGFGAQSIVKDIITGFFVMFEEQFLVGDFVSINDEVEGTVEEMGLRMTTIREWSGKKFYIANSEIRTVRNYNRQELRAIVSVTFPYEEDPVKIRRLLEEVCVRVQHDFHDEFLLDSQDNLIEPPQIYGVTDIDNNDKGGKFTIIAKTKPASIWTVEKMLREYIWQDCHRQNIDIAYPRRIYLHSTGCEEMKN